MGQLVVMTLTTGGEAENTVEQIFLKSTTAPREEAQAIENFFSAAAAGTKTCKVDVQVNHGDAVQAAGTFELDTVIATDAVSINGVAFTAVASGATGNQFNVGEDDAETAANLAAAINASETDLVVGVVTAEAEAETVTVTAVAYGLVGNSITIASADATITASGARLEDGAEASANVYHFGL